jgi:hypothetical protein
MAGIKLYGLLRPIVSCEEYSCEYIPKMLLIRHFLKRIGLHHPLDGVTDSEYKLMHFIQLINFFAKRRRH